MPIEPLDDAPDSIPAGAVAPDPPATRRRWVPGVRRRAGSGRPRRPSRPLWQESLLLLAIAVGLAVVVKTFVAQSFYIPSESMEPGLVVNDRIVVQKWSSWFGGEPQRGDVVVFADPGSWLPPADDAGPTNVVAKALTAIGLYPSGGHLVKRVIGVEGDVISCCDEQGRIKVNGVPIDERAYAVLDGAPCYGPMIGCTWTAGPVPPGKIFVMGDNRSHSADSTVHLCTEGETDCVAGREFVPDSLVVGRVAAVVWPFSHLDLLSRPDAFADVPSAG